MSALKLKVVSSVPIGQMMRRLVFQGEGLTAERIPSNHAGLHIKLFFNKTHQSELSLPTAENGKVVWPAKDLKPISRTYSIFDFDVQNQRLSVDFVLHDTPGVACDFARNAQPGDVVGFAGPGKVQLTANDASQFLLVADLSSVPAVSAVTRQLPANVKKHIFVELENLNQSADLLSHYFKHCENDVRFVQQTFTDGSEILESLQALRVSDNVSDWSITLAGEHSTVVSLRKYFRELELPKSNLYAVPYWRHTFDEDTYHDERHRVMDS